MRYDVVIVTHRDLVAHAPQPAYLARALRARGVRVALVSTAPKSVCTALAADGVTAISTAGLPRTGPRFAFVWLYLLAFTYAMGARVVVNFDIPNLFPVAVASKLKKVITILYWLEAFYEQGRTPTIKTRLGLASLPLISPPDAIVDVNPQRLEMSRQRCGNPDRAFVVPNVPPRSFAVRGAPLPRRTPPRLVYAGSTTGGAVDGLRLLIRGLAMSDTRTTLAILPAHGAEATGWVTSLIAECVVGDRVTLLERVDRVRLPYVLAEYDIGAVLYPGRDIGLQLPAPNKLYEYLACGLAVLASDNDSLSFVAAEGLGWNVSRTDAGDLAAALREAEDRPTVDRYRERAFEAFIQTYSYECQAESLVDWIRCGTRLSGGG